MSGTSEAAERFRMDIAGDGAQPEEERWAEQIIAWAVALSWTTSAPAASQLVTWTGTVNDVPRSASIDEEAQPFIDLGFRYSGSVSQPFSRPVVEQGFVARKKWS